MIFFSKPSILSQYLCVFWHSSFKQPFLCDFCIFRMWELSNQKLDCLTYRNSATLTLTFIPRRHVLLIISHYRTHSIFRNICNLSNLWVRSLACFRSRFASKYVCQSSGFAQDCIIQIFWNTRFYRVSTYRSLISCSNIIKKI